MEIFQVDLLPPIVPGPTVLAVGKFDGVHIGHHKILEAAKAQLDGAKLAVMSIWPHPAYVFQRLSGYERALTPSDEKRRLLEAQGVQVLFEVEFSKAYAETTAETFVREHLTRLGLQRIVVGSDFRFGRGGAADTSVLTDLCSGFNIPVTVVRPVEENGVKVSSSQIRKHIEAGRVEAAEVLLGRPYTFTGRVVHGDARGRQIGFPTANLDLDASYVLPAAGVYAVSVCIADGSDDPDSCWIGVLNAGVRPTVDGREFRLEVHILDFSGDLYGKGLRVSLLRRIRSEQKFDGLDALKRQIGLDVEQVRAVFQGA